MSLKTEKNFSFKDFDLEGMQTLEAVAEAPRLNQWMYQTISKNLNGNVLEVGSGIGNISEQFFKDNRSLCISDVRANYCDFLNKKFEGDLNLKGVIELDLVHPQFEKIYAEYLNTFDGLFALNVVEHIKDDALAIANCKKLLRKGGRLVILVPAYQALYNKFDEALEHYRRYNKKTLSALFHQADLPIQKSYYFNFAGIFGWFISGKIQKNEILPTNQMKLYNTLVPIFKIADKVILNKVGLSVVVEGMKKG